MTSNCVYLFQRRTLNANEHIHSVQMARRMLGSCVGGGSERALTIHAGLAGREYTKRKREKTTMSEICGKQDSLAPH